jgi:Chlorophyll A-B binding protein
MAEYFNGLNFLDNPGLSGLEWYREIELMHGRIAQMAVLGFIIPGLIRVPGLEDVTSNPVAAISETPYAGVWQVIAFMGFVDLFRINRIRTLGKDYTPGDFGWGQGEGRYNPFGFNFTPERYFEKQVQETKHGRLAMIALIGLVIQANVSGVGVLDQLSPAFAAPAYFGKAGYYFPAGI